jgi:hypothetical protein
MTKIQFEVAPRVLCCDVRAVSHLTSHQTLSSEPIHLMHCNRVSALSHTKHLMLTTQMMVCGDIPTAATSTIY